MIGAAEDTAQTGRKGFPCSGPSLAVAPSEEGGHKGGQWGGFEKFLECRSPGRIRPDGALTAVASVESDNFLKSRRARPDQFFTEIGHPQREPLRRED